MLPHKRTTVEEEEDVAAADAGLEEERRLFYVALTRAKRGLSLSWSKTRLRWGQQLPSTPSRFLAEMGSDGVVVQDGCSNEPASAEFRKSALQELAARFPPKPARVKEAP
jgi:superfamily I DNA/RNA helicase